jgi:hypothetical protein
MKAKKQKIADWPWEMSSEEAWQRIFYLLGRCSVLFRDLGRYISAHGQEAWRPHRTA